MTNRCNSDMRLAYTENDWEPHITTRFHHNVLEDVVRLLL